MIPACYIVARIVDTKLYLTKRLFDARRLLHRGLGTVAEVRYLSRHPSVKRHAEGKDT